MRIIDIREQPVPLHAAIKNSIVDFSQMTVSMVAVVSDQERNGRPLIGYGFDSIGRYAQGGLLRERFIPRLMEAGPDQLDDGSGQPDPVRAAAVMMANEKPGGHGERSAAVAAVELALWDLAAKASGEPLAFLLARRFRGTAPNDRIEVYGAGGYYSDDGSTTALEQEMSGYLESGYNNVKMKIGGAPLADDLERIEAVLALVPSGANLAVDANARFDLETAAAYASALAQYGLRWFEEPVDPLDYAAQAELCAGHPMPYATGENLFSHQDVRNLVRHAGLQADRDWLQMDPGLGYGIGEYVRMIDAVEAGGWSRSRIFPHGGNLIALHAAAGLGLGGTEAYPGVFQPFGGFGEQVAVDDGTVGIPDAPGLGLETKRGLRPILEQLAG